MGSSRSLVDNLKFMSSDVNWAMLSVQRSVYFAAAGWNEDAVNRARDGKFARGSGGGSSGKDSSRESRGGKEEDSLISETMDNILSSAKPVQKEMERTMNDVASNVKKMSAEQKAKVKNALNSPEARKVRAEIKDEITKVSDEAADFYGKAVADIEEDLKNKPLENAIADATSTAANAVKNAAKSKEEKKKSNGAAGAALAIVGSAAAVAGLTLAIGATGGMAGAVMLAGGMVAGKTFSIPNVQQRGGKFAAEKFMMKDSKNESDIIGHTKEYMKGGAKNLAFDVGAIAAVAGLAVVAYEATKAESGDDAMNKTLTEAQRITGEATDAVNQRFQKRVDGAKSEQTLFERNSEKEMQQAKDTFARGMRGMPL